MKVADEAQTWRVSPARATGKSAFGWALVWREELTVADASYIAPHFAEFALPEGAWVVVKSPDGKYAWNYTGFGKSDRRLDDGFWSDPHSGFDGHH